MDDNEIKKGVKIEGFKLPESQGKAGDGVESKEVFEVKELSKDNLEHKEVRKKLETMDLDDGLKAQVQSTVRGIKDLKAEEKVQHLLKVAEQKGVIFAVQAAKKMDDSYVLDALHDALAAEGLYKEFLK